MPQGPDMRPEDMSAAQREVLIIDLLRAMLSRLDEIAIRTGHLQGEIEKWMRAETDG
jgi:hypothetical protein